MSATTPGDLVDLTCPACREHELRVRRGEIECPGGCDGTCDPRDLAEELSADPELRAELLGWTGEEAVEAPGKSRRRSGRRQSPVDGTTPVVERSVAPMVASLPASANGGSARPTPLTRGRRVVLTAASEITPERLSWLWRERLPLRGLSLIAGEAGLGKSTLTATLAADVTRGRLDGELHGEPADVLIASAEDHFASVVWGRLTAAGADMERVHRLSAEDRDGETLLTLPDDVADLERRCVELADSGQPVALVVVDPVAAFIGGSVDSHKDASVRRVLAPLAGLAERQKLAAVGIAHLNKDSAGKLLGRVGGSVAFGAAPRSVLAFARHPDDPNGEQGAERVIVAAKSNHGRHARSLAARIEGREVPEVGSVSKLVIVGECEIGTDDLRPQSAAEHEDRDAAADWLATELADGKWHQAAEVKARAKDAEHKIRTLQRARKALKVEDRRGGFPAVSEWRLPVVPPPACVSGTTDGGTTAPTRIVEPNTADPTPSCAITPEGGTTGPDGTVTRSPDDPCSCAWPARSPRAEGADLCQNCKRPMPGAGSPA